MTNIPPQNRLFSLNCRISISVGLGLFFCVVFLTSLYCASTGDKEKILTFFAAVCAMAGQLASALYAARALNISAEAQHQAAIAQQNASVAAAEAQQKTAEVLAQQKQETLHQKKLDQSALFGTRWNEIAMRDPREISRHIITLRGNTDAIKGYLSEDPKRATDLRQMLNFFEEISTSIEMGQCDEQYVKELFKGPLISMWQVCETWIREERASCSRPLAWKKLEFRAEQWA